MGYLKRHPLRPLVDLLFGGLGTFPHTLLLYELRVKLSYWKDTNCRAACVSCQQIMIDGRQLGLIFGLRFRPVARRPGLRVADGLSQHLTQLSLRLRWFPRD